MQETQTCVLEADLIKLGVYTKFVQVPKSSLFVKYIFTVRIVLLYYI